MFPVAPYHAPARPIIVASRRMEGLMRRGIVCLLGLVAVTSGFVLAQSTSEEPPERFVLHVEGEKVAVELGRPFEIRVGERQVSMTLTAMPTRRFEKAGVAFEYPRDFSYEFENAGEASIWTLGGEDVAVTLQKYHPPGTSGSYAAVFVEGLLEAYGTGAKKTVTRRTLGGVLLKGYFVEATTSGTLLRQEVLAIPGTPARLLILDDFPEDGGSSSAEYRKVLRYLHGSFSASK